MRNILLTAAIIGLTSNLFALPASNHYQLNNYSELSEALNRGDNVRAVIAFGKCTEDSGTKKITDDETMGIRYTAFYQQHLPNENNKMAITTSDSRIIDDKSYNNGRVFAYKLLRVYEDNSATFYAGFYHAKSLKLIAGGTSHCQINNGITLYDMG